MGESSLKKNRKRNFRFETVGTRQSSVCEYLSSTGVVVAVTAAGAPAMGIEGGINTAMSEWHAGGRAGGRAGQLSITAETVAAAASRHRSNQDRYNYHHGCHAATTTNTKLYFRASLASFIHPSGQYCSASATHFVAWCLVGPFSSELN